MSDGDVEISLYELRLDIHCNLLRIIFQDGNKGWGTVQSAPRCYFDMADICSATLFGSIIPEFNSFQKVRLAMDESRKQFEEWIKAERPRLFLDYLTTYTPNQYADPATERLWQAWQASRQALEDNQKGE